jgi:hypothetical protein
MGLLKNIGVPLLIAFVLMTLLGLNILLAIGGGFAIYYGFLFFTKSMKSKPKELIFKDHYEDITSELVKGSVRSCPEGDFKLILKGSQRFGIPATELGSVIGISSIRKYQIVNTLRKKPKNFTDFIEIKRKVGEKEEIVYKFYDDVTYGILVVSMKGLAGILKSSVNIIVPLQKVSPLAKNTILDGFAIKCINKNKHLYVLEWEEKDDIYNEVEERTLQDSLYQKRNIEVVNLSANANEVAAKLNSPTMVAKEGRSLDV